MAIRKRNIIKAKLTDNPDAASLSPRDIATPSIYVLSPGMFYHIKGAALHKYMEVLILAPDI